MSKLLTLYITLNHLWLSWFIEKILKIGKTDLEIWPNHQNQLKFLLLTHKIMLQMGRNCKLLVSVWIFQVLLLSCKKPTKNHKNYSPDMTKTVKMWPFNHKIMLNMVQKWKRFKPILTIHGLLLSYKQL